MMMGYRYGSLSAERSMKARLLDWGSLSTLGERKSHTLPKETPNMIRATWVTPKSIVR